MYTRSIFYYETDRMGIVHNSNYLRIFEEARLHYMNEIGANYPQLEAAGIVIPQTEAFVKYTTPIRYGDTITVIASLTEFNGIVMRFDYNIFVGSSEKPAASGYTKHCFLDDAKRIPVNLKKKAPASYAVLAQHLHAAPFG